MPTADLEEEIDTLITRGMLFKKDKNSRVKKIN